MIAIPLLILALAAGVYLLINVTREYLGAVFKALAWLVIILSLASIFLVLGHGIRHFKNMHDGYGGMRQERVIIHDSGDNGMGGSCMMMQGCKMIGDSVILDKAVCEKLMGKDSCAQLCAQRGQCILSKDECIKMCGGANKCMMMGAPSQSPCCMKGGQGAEMKECCKKK